MARNPHPQPTQAAGHRGTATHPQVDSGVAQPGRHAKPHSRSSAGRRHNRPVIAAAASVALVGLVAVVVAHSGGTLALWSKTAETAGGVVLAGDLAIVPCANEPNLRWEETSGDVTNPRSSQAGDILADFEAMPGDSIRLSQCIEVTLDGDNLASAVEIKAWAGDPAIGLVPTSGSTLVPDSRISGTYAIKDLSNSSYPAIYNSPTDPNNPPVSQSVSPPAVGDSVYVLVPALARSDPNWGNARTLRWDIEIAIKFAADYIAPGQLANDSTDFGYDDAYRDLDQQPAPMVTPADIELVQFGIIANQVRFGEGWAP